MRKKLFLECDKQYERKNKLSKRAWKAAKKYITQNQTAFAQLLRSMFFVRYILSVKPGVIKDFDGRNLEV